MRVVCVRGREYDTQSDRAGVFETAVVRERLEMKLPFHIFIVQLQCDDVTSSSLPSSNTGLEPPSVSMNYFTHTTIVLIDALCFQSFTQLQSDFSPLTPLTSIQLTARLD